MAMIQVGVIPCSIHTVPERVFFVYISSNESGLEESPKAGP